MDLRLEHQCRRERCKTIQTVEQHFFYDWIDVVNEIATTTVSKFNCSVSRSTEKNNKHLFINQSK